MAIINGRESGHKRDTFISAAWSAFEPAKRHNIAAARIELLLPFGLWDQEGHDCETTKELYARWKSGKLTREHILATASKHVNEQFAQCYLNALESESTPALWLGTALEPWKGVAITNPGA